MANTSIFSNGLRSKRLPLILSLMLLVLAAMQSLHDPLDHGDNAAGSPCEYCLISQHMDAGVIPSDISLPANLIDPITETLLPLVFPLALRYSQFARAPPFALSL